MFFGQGSDIFWSGELPWGSIGLGAYRLPPLVVSFLDHKEVFAFQKLCGAAFQAVPDNSRNEGTWQGLCLGRMAHTTAATTLHQNKIEGGDASVAHHEVDQATLWGVPVEVTL